MVTPTTTVVDIIACYCYRQTLYWTSPRSHRSRHSATNRINNIFYIYDSYSYVLFKFHTIYSYIYIYIYFCISLLIELFRRKQSKIIPTFISDFMILEKREHIENDKKRRKNSNKQEQLENNVTSHLLFSQILQQQQHHVRTTTTCFTWLPR